MLATENTVIVAVSGTKAFAAAGTGWQRHPDAAFGGGGLLARRHLHELRPVRALQCNRHRYPVRLRTIDFRCDLPDSGAGQSFRWANPDLRPSAAQRPCLCIALINVRLRSIGWVREQENYSSYQHC